MPLNKCFCNLEVSKRLLAENLPHLSCVPVFLFAFLETGLVENKGNGKKAS